MMKVRDIMSRIIIAKVGETEGFSMWILKSLAKRPRIIGQSMKKPHRICWDVSNTTKMIGKEESGKKREICDLIGFSWTFSGACHRNIDACSLYYSARRKGEQEGSIPYLLSNHIHTTIVVLVYLEACSDRRDHTLLAGRLVATMGYRIRNRCAKCVCIGCRSVHEFYVCYIFKAKHRARATT